MNRRPTSQFFIRQPEKLLAILKFLPPGCCNLLECQLPAVLKFERVKSDEKWNAADSCNFPLHNSNEY